jgi:hypothetical protein
MVWRTVYHHLRTSILRDPWDDWLVREAFRNRHFWCREVRVCTHLRFLSC